MKEDHETTQRSISSKSILYTEKQGQYMALIYYYTKVNGYPPAETDFQWFFHVSPPSVHRMIVELETKKLIARIPRQPRSVRILVHSENLPPLL